MDPEAACQRVAGVTGWYLSTYEARSIVYCRTAPKRTEDVVGDIWRACRLRGAPRGYFQINRNRHECGVYPNEFAISPGDACRTLHGTTAVRVANRGQFWCLP